MTLTDSQRRALFAKVNRFKSENHIAPQETGFPIKLKEVTMDEERELSKHGYRNLDDKSIGDVGGQFTIFSPRARFATKPVKRFTV